MTTPTLMERIYHNDYDRMRFAPSFSDPMYLHLVDLKDELSILLDQASGRWLDFGANTSPYRSLLDQAALLRADISPSPGLDFLIEPGSPCPAGDAEFDGILSTQVLEHVPSPQAYLQDCLRMLRPGGRLVLTTHGSWEDHGCPGDFWRWTADGLRRELRLAGFEVVRCRKLTADLRGLIQLAVLRSESLKYRRRSLVGSVLHLSGRLIESNRLSLAKFADRSLGHLKSTEDPASTFYLALAIDAVKS